MAINYPTYAVPRGYDKPDILGQFAKGLSFGQGIKNENDAKDALSAYVDTLYPNGAPPQDGQSLAALDPGSQLVNGEHAAAAGAVDPRLAAFFGGNVNSSGVAATAATDPSLAPILAAYTAKTAQNESGGSNTAKNPNSSALGKYQFLTATWDGLMQAHPELGLTADGRTDPAQQDRAMMAFTTDNARQLKSAGLPINPGTLYAAHFLGAGGATNVLGLADNTPMVSAVSPEVIQANPMLANMSVGDFKAWTAQHAATPQGGYQPPMAQPSTDMSGGAQPAAGAPQFGQQPALPPREVLLSLVRNPATRDMGIALMRARTDPTVAASLASTQADISLKNAEAHAWGFGGKAPMGMRYDSQGNLVPIPVVSPSGAALGTDTTAAPTGDGTTSPSAVIDPTAPGFSTTPVVGALTKGAIYQQALANITNGTTPPASRTGIGGAQNAAVANMMALLDPYGNLAANKAVTKTLTQSLGMQQKYFDNTQRAFNTANDTLAALQTYMQQNGINPSDFPDINSFTNFLKAHGKDAGDVAGYNAQLQTLRSEYSQVLAKGGARSVETDNAASQLIPDGLPPAQLAKVAAQIKIDSNNAISEARKQVSSITGQINGIANGAPQDQNSAAPAPDNSTPVTAINPQTGQRLQLTNGQWVPIQ